MSVRKASGWVQVPREVLLDAGVIEPTPDERAEAERRHAEYRVREAARQAALDRYRTALDAITEQPARAVLDLHCENARHECEGDDYQGSDCDTPDWPCRTVEAIAKHYGITLEDL